MFKIFSSKNQAVIGLDLQPGQLTLLQFNKINKNLEVDKWGRRELSQDIVLEGKILNSSALSLEIKTLAYELNLDQGPIAIALPTQNVMINQVKLPQELTYKECEMEIHANSKRYLPNLSDALTFDFYMKNAMDILVIAARQSLVNDYIKVVSEAGFTLQVVDVALYALIRGAIFCEPSLGALALFDINETYAQFVLFEKPYTAFNYILPVIDFDRHLQHLVEVYQKNRMSFPINRIHLSGKQNLLEKYSWVIENFFQMPVCNFNPFSSVSNTNSFGFSGDMVLSCGLALRDLP